jgi:hypothetical protein
MDTLSNVFSKALDD